MAADKTARRVLVRTFAGRLQDAGLAREIAAYLLSTGRTAELDSLLRDLTVYRAADDIIEVTAVTAHPLDERLSQEVERQVKAIYPSVRQTIINNRIDPSVMAGVKLEFPGQQLDLTARAKLNKLKQLTGKDR